MSNSTCFSLYFSNALENEVFKTMQVTFKDMSVVFNHCFLCYAGYRCMKQREKEEDGETGSF